VKKTWYWTLFGVETAGMVFILYITLPFYRLMLRGPAGDRPGARLILPAVCVVTVMQICYWSKRKIRPPVRRHPNALIANVLLFVSRLSFIFAGAVFSLTVFTRSGDTRTSPIGIAALIAATFAQFCYVRELENLARKFEDPA